MTVRDDLGGRARFRRAMCTASDLTEGDVTSFWERFVPLVSEPVGLGDWETLESTARALRIRFGAEQLRLFERLHQRAVHLLEGRVEPHVYGDARPRWHVEHPFHLHAALGVAVFDGESAFLDLWRRPGQIVARAEQIHEASLLYPTGLFRWDMVRAMLLSLRARVELSRAPDMPFGMGRHKAFLLGIRPAPQWLPTCSRAADGDWDVPVDPFEQDSAPPNGDPAAVRPKPPELVGGT